jgi:MFS family permease
MTAAVATPPALTYRWVVLAAATVAQAAACFFVQGLGAISGYLQHDLVLSTFQLGLLMSAAQLVPLVGLLVAGELVDRLGERAVVGLGTFTVGITLLLGALAPSYGWLLAALVIVGAGYSTAQPGGSKSVAGWFATSQRGLAMGIRQAGLPLGGALAAASLPFVAGRWGWQSTLVTGGLVALAGATVFVLLYHRPPSDTLINPVATDGGAAPSSRLGIIADPVMSRIVSSGTALISVQYGVLLLTTLHLHALGLSLPTAASLLLLAQLLGAGGRIVLAAVSDRPGRGRFPVVRGCLAASAVGITALAALPEAAPLWVVAFAVAWLGFFGFGWYGPWVAHVAEAAPADRTGFSLGLAMALNQVAIVLVPPALGLLADQTGDFRTSWACLVIVAVLALSATRPPRGRRWMAARRS